MSLCPAKRVSVRIAMLMARNVRAEPVARLVVVPPQTSLRPRVTYDRARMALPPPQPSKGPSSVDGGNRVARSGRQREATHGIPGADAARALRAHRGGDRRRDGESRSKRSTVARCEDPDRLAATLARSVPVRALQTARRYLGRWRHFGRTSYMRGSTRRASISRLCCRVGRIPCLVARRNIFGSRTERRHRKLGQAIRFGGALRHDGDG